MGKIIYDVALFIALCGCVWNAIAFLIFLLFGVRLTVIDPGMYPG